MSEVSLEVAVQKAMKQTQSTAEDLRIPQEKLDAFVSGDWSGITVDDLRRAFNVLGITFTNWPKENRYHEKWENDTVELVRGTVYRECSFYNCRFVGEGHVTFSECQFFGCQPPVHLPRITLDRCEIRNSN